LSTQHNETDNLSNVEPRTERRDRLHVVAETGRERALLIGLNVYPESREETLEHLEELELLADTAGADTVLSVVQNLPKRDVAHFIGRGKVEELKAIIEEEKITIVIVDGELSPAQARNLERAFERKVVDRTGIILDIFATRARTSEARTQVELAQLQYLLPRLSRMWSHLSKQYGGIGSKGPGETQIESDRRLVRTRITHLREKLERIDTQRETQRKGRAEMFRVALVGYTNAGKSTLMNEVTGAEVLAEDRLFATLDSTVRAVELAPGRTILLSDTVGFIRKLPSHLVASFRSTLAEVREADVLLHVVDASSDAAAAHIATVEETLRDIGAGHVPTIMVLNKVDLIPSDDDRLRDLLAKYPDAVAVSAARGFGIRALRDRLAEVYEQSFMELVVQLPIERWHQAARLYDLADVLDKEFDETNATMRLRFSPKVRDHVERILTAIGAETKGA